MPFVPIPGLQRPQRRGGTPPRRPAVMVVRPRPGRPRQGLLAFAGTVWPCALGTGGIRHIKRESDGGTPAGRHALMALLWRADRTRRPASALPARAARPGDGWCDAPADGRYNRFVRLPFAPSHETLMREDGLYDIVVVLDFNITRRVAGRGSAIFLHCARPGLEPTAGCVALPRETLARLLRRLPARAVLAVP